MLDAGSGEGEDDHVAKRREGAEGAAGRLDTLGVGAGDPADCAVEELEGDVLVGLKQDILRDDGRL